jgi:hypothetical protein
VKFWVLVFILLIPALGFSSVTPTSSPAITQIEIPQPAGRARLPVTVSLGLAPLAVTNDLFQPSVAGTGISIIASVSPFNRLAQSLEVGYMSQGQSLAVDFIWVGYKYYFIGASQAVFRDGTSFSKVRYKGVFLGAGAIVYNLVSTDTTTGESFAYSGMGFTIQTGIEQPIFGRFFGSARLIYMNAVQVADYYGFYALFSLGLPISL